MELLFEKPGYKIMFNKSTGEKAVLIDESAFSPRLRRDPHYMITQRKSDGAQFLRTKDAFCLITEVTETSKHEPVIKFVTIPDELSGLMINDRMVITPPKGE